MSQEFPMSQEFCTPDYITPVEATFGVEYDNGGRENIQLGQQSPTRLTPVKAKRQRADMRSPLGSQDTNMSQESNLSQPSSQPSQGLMMTSMAAPPPPAAAGQYQPPGMKSRVRASRFAKSPPCHANKFLSGADDEMDRPKLPAKVPRPSDRYKADFKELAVIGHGSYGKVYKVLGRLDGCEYAIKRSSKSLLEEKDERLFINEVAAMAAAGSHPNIVRYYSAWMESSRMSIQMELCEGALGNMLRAGRTFTHEEILDVFVQLNAAVQHLHSLDIVHMDIKPDNVFVRGGVYKLGDFGNASKRWSKGDAEPGDGKYMPQEALNNPTALDKVDMFSLGATVYAMVLGRDLPSGGPEHAAIREGKLTLVPTFSATAARVIRQLLDKDPAERPLPERVAEQLKAAQGPRKGPIPMVARTSSGNLQF